MARATLTLTLLLALPALAACGGGGGGGGAPSALAVTGCAPDSDFQSGGATMTLSGRGFADPGVSEVVFGDIPATDLVVLDDGRMTCTVPPGPPGTFDLVVRGGGAETTLPNGFTWYGFPPASTQGAVRLNTNDVRTGQDSPAHMARSGDYLYAVWLSSRDGMYDVWMNASSNGGATWWGQDQRVSGAAAGTIPSDWPDVCASGDTAYVVWLDEPDIEHPEIWFAALDAGGTSLAVRTRVDPGVPSIEAFDPRVACSGDSVYVVWVDCRVWRGDIYFRASHDRGRTWEPEVRLDPGPEGDISSTDPRICADGEHVYVIWREDAGPHFRASHDRGTTWSAGAVPAPDLPVGYSGENAELACDGLHVYAVWQEWTGTWGAGDICAQASHDGGANWMAATVRLNEGSLGLGVATTPRVACAGTNVYVAWTDGRRGDDDAYFRASTDGGAGWGTAEQRLNPLHNDGDTSESPDLDCSGNIVHVAWHDDVLGGRETYLLSSTDAGTSWSPAPLRLDLGVVPAIYTRRPVVIADGARALVAWSEGPAGGTDVFFNANEP